MKRLLGLALLAGISSVSGNAAADTPYSAEFIDGTLATVGFGALDLGMAIVDVASSEQEKVLPRFYGGVETLAAGAQVGLCLDYALTTHTGYAAAWGMGAGIGAIFLAHGIVTLVAPWSHTEAPTPRPLAVAPLVLSDVARGSVSGLAVLGRF